MHYKNYRSHGLLRLVKKSENEFVIKFPKYMQTFKLVENVKASPHTLAGYKEFLEGATLIQIEPQTNEIKGKYWNTYQSNGKARYRALGSSSSWESNYIIVEFAGNYFLKGITSAPILLNRIEDERLWGYTVDQRFDPEKNCWSKATSLKNLRVYASSSNKAFEIDVYKVALTDCVSNLSSADLKKEISVYKGVSNEALNITQVQHTYGCDWTLFNENGKPGFEKFTMGELLTRDSSLCLILDIPCGYYAERKNIDDKWYVYLHEDRVETDSSFIIKKAFRWNNTYRVINELKNGDVVHYEDYDLDTRILRKTWTYHKGKEVGVTRIYNELGELKEEIRHGKK